MAEYSKEEIRRIEDKWRAKWEEDKVYEVQNNSSKPKYYVLDMFPYPSGAGLHVGHPLGYIASDIVSRYKRLKGFNVLHPMGFDAFGLPAEQYAIQTGQHPAITTAKNIETYKRQLKQIGLSFDWSREVQTSDPKFYQWTQWIFMQLFNAWYNNKKGKAEPIMTLIYELRENGNADIDAVCNDETPSVTAAEWNAFDEVDREKFLQNYRIAYQSETMVNWCAALGTVLSNDEVKDGVSERGGYPVERIKMLQWSMRISAYAERLLNGLDTIDWPEPLKEMQRNWIGKSVGCELEFVLELSGGLTSRLSRDRLNPSPKERDLKDSLSSKDSHSIKVFTTRIDTIYGVTFMVLAPEHELVEKITTDAQREEVIKYVEVAKNRSERERMSEVKRISGVFTGAYCINPFNNEKVPVWIADYVLAGYGTGAVMAVPSSDTRDYAFAKHFNLPIIPILEGPHSDIAKENFDPKSGTMINSDFLNGLPWNEAIEKALQKVEQLGIGKRRVNFRMRDAIFGRQRYWGEPFPVYYKDGIPHLVDEEDLPITLPEIDEYKPTETGEPPLARAKEWRYSLTSRLSRDRLNPSPLERDLKESSSKEDHLKPQVKGYETTEKSYWNILKQFSKEHRFNPTSAEAVLWEEVRNNKLGHKIRRQHAIGVFIADFVCLSKKLVIEIDGAYHEKNKEYDQTRTHFLHTEGFRLIRFTNQEVLNDLSGVVAKISKALNESPSKGTPSPLERGPGGEAAYPFELTTMPGWAGSSWYWYRYMDPQNEDEFCSKEAESYWKDVDLYIGGSEHATGHLLYSRFWNKALKDLGYVEAEEPFKKLINQGHIQGISKFVYKLRGTITIDHNPQKNDTKVKAPFLYISKKYIDLIQKNKDEGTKMLIDEIERQFESDFISKFSLESNPIIRTHTDIKNVNEDVLNIEGFKKSLQLQNEDPYFLLEDGKYICGSEVEKMSKSKHNVVNPDDIIENYGADTLRMYEMFLGPLEQSKPWNTNGIDGVYKFFRKFWNLFHDAGTFNVSDAEPSREELKVLHKTIKKVEEDIDRFSFNTSVSEFMICANELTALKCNKRSILEPLVIALSPYAPHIAEELWEKLGNKDSILNASFPKYNEQYLVENSFEYPISINGKVRAKMNFALDMPKEDIEKVVLASETIQKWTDGKPPKKVIIVQGKIVNVVL